MLHDYFKGHRTTAVQFLWPQVSTPIRLFSTNIRNVIIAIAVPLLLLFSCCNHWCDCCHCHYRHRCHQCRNNVINARINVVIVSNTVTSLWSSQCYSFINVFIHCCYSPYVTVIIILIVIAVVIVVTSVLPVMFTVVTAMGMILEGAFILATIVAVVIVVVFVIWYLSLPPSWSWYGPGTSANHTQSLAHLLPQRFLSGESQGQVDAIQCHPVDLSLPSWPVPPHGGVALSAHVLVVPESEAKDLACMIISSYGRTQS